LIVIFLKLIAALLRLSTRKNKVATRIKQGLQQNATRNATKPN